MHWTLALATALLVTESSSADFVRRQLDLPPCALPCLTATASTSFGNCSSTDEACLCTNPQFIGNTTTCIEGACIGNDLQTAISAAESLCAQAGVTLNVSSILGSVSATATGPLQASGSASASPSTSAATSSVTVISSSNDASPDYVFPRLLGLGAGVAAWIVL
ncbi:hypothetical protein GGU11DRAFT_766645 [Lentinula aff. detonsa]|nr:hypothetical protein GGU11DRAFT_766645 [Lentinula aff. detonsa]